MSESFETRFAEEFGASLSVYVRTMTDLVFLAVLGDLAKKVVWADSKCGQEFGEYLSFNDITDEYNDNANLYISRINRTIPMLKNLGFQLREGICLCAYTCHTGCYPVLRITLEDKEGTWKATRHFHLGK